MKYEQTIKAKQSLRMRDFTCKWELKRLGLRLVQSLNLAYFTYNFSGYVQDTQGSKTLLRLSM